MALRRVIWRRLQMQDTVNPPQLHKVPDSANLLNL